MNSSTTHLEFENNNYGDPIQLSRILSACLYMYKGETGYTWEKIADNLLTTRKTLCKIRKAEEPIRLTTFRDLLNRLQIVIGKKPKKSDTNATTGNNMNYECHPDCPYIRDYQREKAFEKLIIELIKLIK